MSLFRRHRWFFAAAGITLAFAAVSFTSHRSLGLTIFADLAGLILMLAGLGVSISNARSRPRTERSFWALMALAFALWTTNQLAWTYWETILRKPVPDPFFYDIILFFHTVPMIAAVAWRPDMMRKEGRVLLSVLNFLTLLGWWIFLYAFIVFPHQYIAKNIGTYNVFYDRLYGLENIVLLAVLALAALTSAQGWRQLYTQIFAASILYAVNSQFLDRAAADNTYYSGGPYDIALIGTVSWILATSISAREWNLQCVEFRLDARLKRLVPQMAMLAILSLPVLGVWTLLADHSAIPSKQFRIFAVLSAMFVLGAFVFLRQYVQDQTLISLLEESRHTYDHQTRLQNQLVQKEKLASLGNLIAGAAHDINLPLNAIMTYSEQFWAHERLTEDQNVLVRKIVNQARRTGDLISNLLSFARQAPGERILVDIGLLLNRATQLLESRRPAASIRIHLSVSADFPPVRGNANQLFQAFVEIIENAMDALDDAGGGSLVVTAHRLADEAIVQFSDTGPGLREPQRVFDPFYTTKPVGKGTGLGLSAVYGVVQNHGGQISCQNRPEGGALFILKFPASTEPAAQSAVSAGA